MPVDNIRTIGSCPENNASEIGYKAETPANWYSEPHDVESALDQLGANTRRTQSLVLYAKHPQAADVYLLGYVPYAVHFVEVHGVTDVGTCTLNIERRAKTTPDVAGTDILTADIALDVGGESTTAFAASGAVAADQWLSVVVTSVASAPAEIWLNAEFKID